MKSFSPKPWFAPQPVLIIGTYNKEGVANAMNAAWAGQWDMEEIMISMGNHVTTDNLKLDGEFTVAFATKKTMVASEMRHLAFFALYLSMPYMMNTTALMARR